MKSSVTKEKCQDCADSSHSGEVFITSAMDFTNCIVCQASASEPDCMAVSIRPASTKLILLMLYLQVKLLIFPKRLFSC